MALTLFQTTCKYRKDALKSLYGEEQREENKVFRRTEEESSLKIKK